MEENNRLETNTDGSGSGSMLYGTESQPQAEDHGNSSVYGAGPQGTTPVQLAKPEGAASESQGTIPVQLTKPTEPASASQSAAPVQLTKPADSASQPQGQLNPYGNGQMQGQLNPYGQPNFNNQPDQNPMGYDPIQMPPPLQGAPAPKPKKNKAGIIAGILCAAAVVLVIAAGVLLAKSLLGGSAEQQLAKGMANMTKEMTAYQSPIVSEIGMEELSQLKDIKPIHTNIDLSFTDPNASGNFASVDIEVDAVIERNKKMADFNLGVGAYGFSMNIGELVAADNTLYVSAPMIFEDVYSLDLTNLGRDFNQSAWSDLMGETIPEDYSLTLFPDIKESDEAELSSKKGVLQKLFWRQGDISGDSVQYETIRQKRMLTLGGVSAEYGGVRVTMNKDAYNESMEAMKDEFLAGDYYADIMKRYEALYGDDFDELEGYIEEFIETLFGTRLEEDFVLDFYLDRKGRIVNISTPEDIAVSSQYSEIDFMAVDIDFAGTERALDSIEGGIYVQSGGEILYMGISREADVTEEYYNEDLTLKIQSDNSDDELVFRYKNTWGYDDRSFDLEMAFEVPDSSMEISADGSFMDIVRGEGFTFRINHSAITIDGEDLILLTGVITMEPADDTIEVPDRAVNILEMSESEILNLLYGYSSLY